MTSHDIPVWWCYSLAESLTFWWDRTPLESCWLVVVLVSIHSYDRWRAKNVQNFNPSSKNSKNYQQSTVHWEYTCHNVELLTREPELVCKYSKSSKIDSYNFDCGHESLLSSSISECFALQQPKISGVKGPPGIESTGGWVTSRFAMHRRPLLNDWLTINRWLTNLLRIVTHH